MVETLTRALRGISLSPKPFLIAVDTEGSSRSGGIREIGAAAVDADDVTFYETVTQRNKGEGLAPRDAARTWAVVGPRFVAWVRSVTPAGRTALLVGHNIARADIPLIRADSAAACPDLSWAGILWADTLPAVRSALPELKKRDQTSVYAALFGAPPPKHCTHTALADARAAASVAAHPAIRAAIEAAPPRTVIQQAK